MPTKNNNNKNNNNNGINSGTNGGRIVSSFNIGGHGTHTIYGDNKNESINVVQSQFDSYNASYTHQSSMLYYNLR